ncbi:MAG: hypothetical protein CMP08_01310 [Xanthomonadales bacterium]|nr:hypothetical protein [Xanthomonadales bacterium]|tara:strand:- start:3110 stop:3586 length:477 start_codon:yes stop_codon:yes gene_type:complete
METIDFLEKNLARQLGWIQAADKRLSLVLPLSTAMLGGLAAVSPAACNWSILAAVFTSFAVVLLCLSVLFCAVSSFPRTVGPKGSLIYFGGIGARDVAQFQSEVVSLTDEKYIEDLARQCHANASIACSKYDWVKRGMASLFLATIPWAFAIYFLYSV